MQSAPKEKDDRKQVSFASEVEVKEAQVTTTPSPGFTGMVVERNVDIPKMITPKQEAEPKKASLFKQKLMNLRQ